MDARRAWIALGVLALPLLLVSMDVSILYFAAPRIAEDLHASATQQLWIFDVYGFVLAGLLITMGAVADRIGARRLLLIGAFAFSVTSVAAAISQNAGELIAARALLGVAGATLMPSTLAMVRTMFTDEGDRAKAVAVWTGVMTAGVSLGPVLGGVLLQHFAWGSVFLVNVPAMVLLLALGPRLLPRTDGRRGVPFDLLGSALSLLAVLPTVFGIKQWAAEGFDLRWIACLLVGIAFVILFMRRLNTHPHPLVPRPLLRNRAYMGAVLANATGTFALVGNAVLVTAYLQLVLGKGPLEAALWSVAPALGVGAAAPVAGVLGPKIGRWTVMAGGFVLAAGGFAILMTIGVDSLVLVLVGAGLLAAGLVVVMTTASELVLAAVEPHEAGAGAAVSEAATELGGALGIATLGSICAAIYRSEMGGGSLATATDLSLARAAYVHGIHVAVLVGCLVMVVASIAAARGGFSTSGHASARSGQAVHAESK